MNSLAGSERRVREVILTAPDKATAHRGSILLEDALHTVSIPGASGRFLLIRHLDVGRISYGYSSTSVSLQIEKKLRHLAVTALPATHPRAGTAPAVFFPNRTEAVVSLAVQLAQGRPVREWFWSLAVPAWRPDEGRETNLRQLLFTLGRSADGPAAIVRLVNILIKESAIEPLLAALTAADGTTLVQFFGWHAGTVEQPAVSITNRTAPILLPLPPIVRTWLRSWPPDDNRAIWLAGMVLASQRLSRLHNPELGRQARSLALYTPRKIVESLPDGHSAEIQNGRRIDDSTFDSRPNLRSPSEFVTTAELTETAEKSSSTGQSHTPDEIHLTEHQNGKTNEFPANVQSDHFLTQLAAEKDKSRQIVSPNVDSGGAEKVQEAHPPDLFQPPELLPPKTGFGGLFLLLPLLAHLGLAAWMRDERWLEVDFPQRLLNLLCRRLNVPDDDPIWQAVTVEPVPVLKPDLFLAPVAWGAELVNSDWQLSRVKQGNHEQAGLRVIVDGSGRMPLAAWHGRTPQIVRRRLLNQSYVRGRPLQSTTILELALKSWLTAVRRWSRRYAQIGLYDLICRPSRIGLTPTHLDLFFDISQVDIRIRRAGLDVNPGWLPWFGQVVTFHYLDAQEVYV